MTASESDALFRTLLESAQRLSFDSRSPLVYAPEPGDDDRHGMTPQWSPVYGTPLWDSMSETERVRLTRCEVAHFLGIGIWLEVGLQVALLRASHSADPGRSDVKFLLNECADENLHSLMFANAIESIGSHFYPRDRMLDFFGWLFRHLAWDEVAYGIVLAGEEVFDVMQRDWMNSDDVAAPIRRAAYIHVVEESRHMAFARRKIRDRLVGRTRFRRFVSTLIIAAGMHLIARSLINRRVYEDLGLDWDVVKANIDGNEHHRMMFRRAAEPFVEFLSREGLLNSGARWIYRKSHLL
ncbi:diiron oxygenase [Rhodococcus hoagii]|uniref:AurF N-oxygenase family protein n=1 Tax=Rhodococcus hoagii TaxID=43767 RepID=UPI001A045890|nr:diiron oxygenase [Prescottella equi]MBM4732920.1 diiron oxygenase [Prescottella equi]MDP8015818.1 diiron oxygenase [Prescottella equi]NKR90177.1 diiron oxygenase [Prescottella equi]NKS06250.1 diiron oxygenase [Prescottella equi]NKS95075.1 diiron oxygenase [Prescottella equi]